MQAEQTFRKNREHWQPRFLSTLPNLERIIAVYQRQLVAEVLGVTGSGADRELRPAVVGGRHGSHGEDGGQAKRMLEDGRVVGGIEEPRRRRSPQRRQQWIRLPPA